MKDTYNMYHDSDTTFEVNGMIYRNGFIMKKE